MIDNLEQEWILLQLEQYYQGFNDKDEFRRLEELIVANKYYRSGNDLVIGWGVLTVPRILYDFFSDDDE